MRIQTEVMAISILAVCTLCGCTRSRQTSVSGLEQSGVSEPTNTLDFKTVIQTKLRRPIGTIVTVEGEMFDGPTKGYEDGPSLRVRKIDGNELEAEIVICLKPYFYDFGESVAGHSPLPSLTPGHVYEFEGYETGTYVGVPTEAFDLAGIAFQTSSLHFRSVLMVYKGRDISP